MEISHSAKGFHIKYIKTIILRRLTTAAESPPLQKHNHSQKFYLN